MDDLSSKLKPSLSEFHPQLKVTPPFAPPTGYIVVEGSGYPHDSKAPDLLQVGVAISCFGKKPIPVEPDFRGRWSARVQIPAKAPPGEHQVVVSMSVTRFGLSSHFQNKTSVTVFTDWAQSGFDAGGSRYNPYENVLSADNVQDLDVVVGSQGWEYSAPGASNFSDPVVGRGYVFIGVGGSAPSGESVYAFSAFEGGQPLWTENGLGSAQTPAFMSDTVIVGTVPDASTSVPCSLWAYSSDGSLRWPQNISQTGDSRPVLGGPLVAAGAVYAIVQGRWSEGLIKVDATTGSPSSSWPPDPVTPPGGDLARCTPAFSDDKVFVVDSSQLYRINAVDGSIEAWTSLPGSITSSPVVSGGLVFVGTEDSGFFAIDKTNMRFKWKWAGVQVGNPTQIRSSPAVTKDLVYFTTYDEVETALHALALKNGHEEWRARVQHGYTRCFPPAVANGVVYLVTEDTLYAYDAAKGLRNGGPLLVWQYMYKGSARQFMGPPVIANGFVYVTMDICGSVLVPLSLPPRP